MRKALFALVAAGLMTSVTLTACDDGGDGGDSSASGTTANATSSGKGKNGVGVVLPDTKTSTRWKNDDPKYLKAAFEAAGVPYEIQNAEGDKEMFKAIAAKMIDSGVKVLVIANLDSGSGKAVIENARAHKVPVIDYDRLTLNGGADYYVSFNNQLVGIQQAQGLIKCMKAQKGADKPVVAELNGSPSDNNARLFKEGYDSVLQAKFDNGDFTKGPDQFVPEWDNDEGKEIFTQMLKQWPDISGVLAANDGLGNAAIEVLRAKGLNGKVPVTGQDATVEGLQNIIAGDQCMTVYKATKREANAAADLAIGLVKGQKKTAADRVKDPESGAYVPAVLLPPTAVTATNIMSTVVKDGFVTTKDICTAKFLKDCRRYGLAAE
ncbi:sugar ABC transporter substrate-binding protein [Actinoplanes teichomyceticus]|uniref:D-xylose transport system substrate-binding protein n=1 Tax=Actinoplanes teichomyceticus TaxID=1867 RepID=A0A561WLF5_ACTTI|nr:substrate-binding domain-containing protein [Actinoplanes teichomyceticus]TWG24689.1 D-xylose transport system substrate-binding protein [Actinoplanes teichomyceticus]GIF14648.1 sugar ABC transporter substrate-binding protein [Actinoplanes teichomyceticus]